VHTDFSYDEDGLIRESISREGDQTSREVFHYQDGELVKQEGFVKGLRSDDADFPEVAEKDDDPSAQNDGEVMVYEKTIETDPQGRYMVRLMKQLVSRGYHGPGPNLKYWPSKVEILFDEQKRITDVLACETKFEDPALGVECDGNAYYFFEYED
jgi:hypothetical protein